MSWTCSKCGTPHALPEERQACRRRDRVRFWIEVNLLLAIVVILIGLDILHAVLVYDDWTCAFAECRKLKP